MNNRRRLAAASMAAVITAAAGYPLSLFTICLISEPKDFKNAALLGGMVFGYAFVVAAAHLVFLGMPAVLILKKMDALRLQTIALAGFLAGSAPAAFLSLQLAAWGGLFGILGALAFWAVWRRSSDWAEGPAAQ